MARTEAQTASLRRRCAALESSGRDRQPRSLSIYLEAGGTLENAQAMAAHDSPRNTKLHDRTGYEIALDEVERITG